MILLLATVLMAQAQPEPHRQGAAVPDSSQPAASEHGVTSPREVAPGARKAEHEQARKSTRAASPSTS